MSEKCYRCGKIIPDKHTRIWGRLPNGEIDLRPMHITCTPYKPRLTRWQRATRLINQIIRTSQKGVSDE